MDERPRARFLLAPDRATTLAIEDALAATFFAGTDRAHLRSETGRRQLANHSWERHDFTVQFVIPWLERLGSLAGQRVVEVGCGTGAIAAALSHFVGEVHGYDFHEPSMQAAAARLRAQRIDNVTLHTLPVADILPAVRQRHHGATDMVMLFGVLEHQTIGERIATLEVSWDVLRPGGLLVVLETPNRLTYSDGHTTQRPFFDQLPPELAIAELRASHPGLRPTLDAAAAISPEEERTAAIRFGQGVSFHEFAAALGDGYADWLALDGYEDEIVRWFAPCLEEDMLQLYVHENGLPIPYGFCRHLLTLAFRKQAAPATRAAGPPPLPFLRGRHAAGTLSDLRCVQALQHAGIVDSEWSRLRRELEVAASRVTELQAQLAGAATEHAALHAELAALRGSLTWRLSRWLAAPVDRLRRMPGSGPSGAQ